MANIELVIRQDFARNPGRSAMNKKRTDGAFAFLVSWSVERLIACEAARSIPRNRNHKTLSLEKHTV
jgi:hypothetical protein